MIRWFANIIFCQVLSLKNIFKELSDNGPSHGQQIPGDGLMFGLPPSLYIIKGLEAMSVIMKAFGERVRSCRRPKDSRCTDESLAS